MSKYTIHASANVFAWVEVEADSEEEARDMFESGDITLPYAPGFANYEFSDEWELEDVHEGTEP